MAQHLAELGDPQFIEVILLTGYGRNEGKMFQTRRELKKPN